MFVDILGHLQATRFVKFRFVAKVVKPKTAKDFGIVGFNQHVIVRQNLNNAFRILAGYRKIKNRN